MWRATCRKVSRQACAKDFNPRLPWGGRRVLAFSLFDAVIFQSKPSVGRATCAAVFRRRRFAFQSKPSVGRATAAHKARHRAFFYFNPRPPWGGRLKISKPLIYNSFISIHALRGEGDSTHSTASRLREHFNPRPPWGGRPRVY